MISMKTMRTSYFPKKSSILLLSNQRHDTEVSVLRKQLAKDLFKKLVDADREVRKKHTKELLQV